MNLNVHEYLEAGPRLKTVVVKGRPGKYSWSHRLRRSENCIISRWQGGDPVSDWELDWHLGQFVRGSKISRAQRNEFLLAIGRLDRDKGGTEDLRSVRTFAKILGMRVVVKASELPLSEVKPGPHSITYQRAYRLAAFIRKNTQGVEVRLVRTDDADHESAASSWWRSPPGSYAVKASPPKMGN